MYEIMTPEFELKLKTCRSLPSPPSYALQVIELMNDPNVDITQAVKVFSMDPVIVSKILRIANSAMYANQRKVENLQMAILLLGLNATFSLALSFSLVTGLRQTNQEATLNHSLYWKRTGVAAAASRVLGTYCEIRDLEELFIAAPPIDEHFAKATDPNPPSLTNESSPQMVAKLETLDTTV